MTLPMLLDMAAEGFPDRVAVGTVDDGLTFQQLQRAAAGGAALIRASGRPRVAFLGLNSEVFPVLLFAAGTAGVPITPLNYRLSSGQLGELLAQVGPCFLVVDDELLPVVEGLDLSVTTSSAFLREAQACEPLAPLDVDTDAPAVLLFTSGTTSTPKAVVLRHSNLVSYVLQTVEYGSADEEDAALISVPPYHVAGVGTVLTNCYSGRRMVYLTNFDPETWLRVVRAERVSNAMVVPTMLVRLVEFLEGKSADVPCLRSLAYGGARMPAPVLEQALVAFSDTGFVNAYGLTETSSTLAVLGPQDHRAALASDDPAVRARLASAGRVVPGIEMEIRDVDGLPVAVGATGALWVRGPQVSGEYEGSGSVLDDAGWFATRDQAWCDSEGYLFIVGRSDDTIIRGGENIAPAEIEDVLLRHPDVSDVAVFGTPDEEWGERIVAAVVLQPLASASPADLREFVRARLRGSRTPDEVVVHPELPYTPTGKLLRAQLAKAHRYQEESTC